MNILLIGSGGREHALAWKIKQSPLCSRLFIAPGNAGTSSCGTNLPVMANDPEGICGLLEEYQIGMVVIGPEEPLVLGIADRIRKDPRFQKVIVIGPGSSGARLEGSKSFAKAFMQKHGIPTAAYRRFSSENFEEGIAYIREHTLPVVLKADGLAAGKGVLICGTHEEAIGEFTLMLRSDKFGQAGSLVVIEEFLTGIEISVFVLTDGVSYFLLPEAKDYKRIGEGDTGLNTGGMGAVSPVPFFDGELKRKVTERIILPTIHGLQQDGIPYQGFIFFGLIICEGEPYVIEYNCRMGDPETEAVIPRLKNDLVSLFMATCEGRLGETVPEFDTRSAVTIVAVSKGYPGDYETGKAVSGLEKVSEDTSMVFHAGTRREGDRICTSGGRVLAVTSFGTDIPDAARHSGSALKQLFFEGIGYRSDIGYEFGNSR